jgi:catechol 2,3-dioxygenase-like lactoylglutathione lyase family enzyme
MAKPKPALLGLRTAIYPVEDLAEGKAWYAKVLGQEPYFDQPFYVGFDVGGYELGLVPAPAGIRRGDDVVAYGGSPTAPRPTRPS